jgi:CubicO group peptidase (beta-lactamase class C family)
MLPARKIFAATVGLVAVLSVSWCCAAEPNLQGDLNEVLVEEGLTGVAWSLIGEKGEVSLGATGLRDNLSQSDFTIDTRFHVGSVTKSLLATGVLRLVTEGLIELDAPASRYLPDIFFQNPWKGLADVTVRHLLDHTSGLNDAHMWQMFSERPGPETLLIAAFPEPETQLRIRSRPGSRFSYSNMGYTLLGMIIESVVGGRYEAYLDERILAPLAMQDSTFTFTTQEGERADPTLAWGHVDDGSRYAASPIFLRPAGQFTTTVADLARFTRFLLSDGIINDQQFIGRELMQSRGQPSGTEAVNSGLAAGYALGLGRRDRHGVVGYCHGGNIVGFVAMLCIFPDEHKAFAYSVNTDSETANYGRIDSLLIGALKITEVLPPRSANPARDIAGWQGRYILSPNRFQTFEYLDNVFGAVKVSADGDSLVMTTMQQNPRRLRPVGGRIYSADDRATSSHVFLRGEKGEYLLSDGFRTYEKVSTAYLAAHWISILLGLVGLTWLFLAGVISVVRYRTGILQRSETPAFVAIMLLFVPLPFFMTQSFMAIGDFTLASALLAAVTLLLPVGMVLTITRAGKKWKESHINLIHGLGAAFVLQWCAVLFVAGMLPVRLWV